MKNFLIVLLDEMIFRPAVAIINWQPSKKKHCDCCHKDTDCLVYFDEVPVSKHQPSDFDWPTIDRLKRSEWRGKNYGM